MSFISRIGAGCGSALGGLIFLLVGLGMLGFGGYSYLNTNNQMNEWGRTEGQVIDLSRYSDSEGGSSIVPVIRFRAEDGQEYTAEPYQERNTTVDAPNYRVGDTVEVIYNPDNPNDMFINDFMHVWFVPALMGGLGALFGGIGAIWAVGALAGALIFRRPTVAQPVLPIEPVGGPPVIKL